MLTYAERQHTQVMSMVKAHQDYQAHQNMLARNAPYRAQTLVNPSAIIDYQATTQLGEDLFGRTLGETEDFTQACKSANFTREQGERALRNPHVCAIAEDAHAKACQKLIDQLSASVPLASAIADQSSKALKQRFATRSDYNHAWSVAYDDQKRVKRLKQAINGLALRKERRAYAFQYTKWEVPEEVR